MTDSFAGACPPARGGWGPRGPRFALDQLTITGLTQYYLGANRRHADVRLRRPLLRYSTAVPDVRPGQAHIVSLETTNPILAVVAADLASLRTASGRACFVVNVADGTLHTLELRRSRDLHDALTTCQPSHSA